MTDTLNYIVKKFNLNLEARSPITIPHFGRNNLAILLAELGFTKGAEIGTEQGFYAEILCKANPNLHLYCVDPWIAYDRGLGYRMGATQEQFNTFYKQATKRLKPYKVALIKEMSMDAVTKFEEGSLDFVYIDANHRLEYVTRDIVEWAKKVRSGGIVAGHDYIRYKYQQNCHVIEALIAYNGSYRKGLPWFVLDHMPGENRRSWFFVK